MLHNFLPLIFKILGGMLAIFTVLCFVRIIFSWFPGAQYTGFGRFVCALVDPYLNIFSVLPLRFGMLDLSPIVAIGVLTLFSSLLGNIAATGRISLSNILGMLINLAWSVVQSLVMLMLVLFFIRWLVYVITNRDPPYDSIWAAFDNGVAPMVSKIAGLVASGRRLTYKTSLGIACVVLLLVLVAGFFVINVLLSFVALIPF